MKISELQEALEKIKQKEGDIETRVQTLERYWPPELSVRPLPAAKNGQHNFVVLNS